MLIAFNMGSLLLLMVNVWLGLPIFSLFLKTNVQNHLGIPTKDAVYRRDHMLPPTTARYLLSKLLCRCRKDIDNTFKQQFENGFYTFGFTQ